MESHTKELRREKRAGKRRGGDEVAREKMLRRRGKEARREKTAERTERRMKGKHVGFLVPLWGFLGFSSYPLRPTNQRAQLAPGLFIYLDHVRVTGIGQKPARKRSWRERERVSMCVRHAACIRYVQVNG